MSAGHGPFDHVKDSSVIELPGFVASLFGWHEIGLPNIGGFQVTKFMVLQVVAAVLTILIFRGLARRIAGGRPAAGLWWNFWEAIALFIRNEVVRPCIGIPHHHDDHGHGHDNHGHAGHDSSHGASAASHGSGASAANVVDVGHPADKYLPYVWSVFFYILFCNLLGAVPFLGSPTADTSVTGALAFMTFVHVVRYGTERSGFVGFW
ncbi:MAG: ATP synthase F0 subunit A, partial [Planctomycetes bacterium]|nr:ATP synthase F0 subunit A [Planctomycetota bacterium]